jgi:FKBP-type peptidyl-prolyl cis-trans isomerase FklB
MVRLIVQVLFLLLSSVVSVSAAGTNAEGLAFLEENKAKPGVVTLPSGLQYKIVTKGKGPSHPTVDSPCQCHYEGKLLDGTVFDSSYERGEPTTFAPNQVIGGWTEAMQLMVAGDKWELYIPSDLAYGDRGSPPKIPGGSVLIFTMEILGIMGDTVNALACQVNDETTECNEREIEYIAKIKSKAWDAKKVKTEIERVQKLLGKPMSDDLRDWARRRVHILLQLAEQPTTEEEL